MGTVLWEGMFPYPVGGKTMEITTDPVYDSYIFNIVNDAAASNYVFIRSLGYECQYAKQEKPYYWDCHSNEKDNIVNTACILQYTVSGEGAVEINDKTYRLLPGSIFMIERPGPYKYWLPEGSDHWELKFIELSVNALPIWNAITQSFGQVFTMNETGAIITLWDEIFEKTQKGGIQSIYDNALYAYTFLLAVHKYLAEFGARSKNSESIQQCIDYIKENFAQNITITEIAKAGDLSPFYLNKTFKTILGETPIRYVTKIRIRYSMALLYNSDLTIDEIAEQCGFQNANYFSKVFKKYTNMSPTDFRKQHLPPIIL